MSRYSRPAACRSVRRITKCYGPHPRDSTARECRFVGTVEMEHAQGYDEFVDAVAGDLSELVDSSTSKSQAEILSWAARVGWGTSASPRCNYSERRALHVQTRWRLSRSVRSTGNTSRTWL